MLNTTLYNKIETIIFLIFLLINYSVLIYPQENLSATDSTSVKDSIKVDVHPQDISEDAGFIIKNSDNKGELRIYGSVRIAGAYDLNGLTNANSFSTYDIPVGDDAIRQPRFFMVPNQTRLGIDVTRESFIGQVKLKIETDFLGKNNGLRIRHAYVESGKYIIGQTWSTFTDVNSVPATVDIDGPNSSIGLRTVKIRYSSRLLYKNLLYTVSLEAPDPDIILPDSLSGLIPAQFLPDFAGKLTYEYSNGYLVAAGIIRGITVKDSAGSSEQIIGHGLLLAGVYQLDTENQILFQGVYGRAIARFITALNGKGLDLIYNPVTKLFEATRSFGFLFSYSHKWKEGISSAFTTGLVSLNNKDFEGPDAFSSSWYFSGNIFWNAFIGVRLGLEFSRGRRFNKGGESGIANRFGFIIYTDF